MTGPSVIVGEFTFRIQAPAAKPTWRRNRPIEWLARYRFRSSLCCVALGTIDFHGRGAG